MSLRARQHFARHCVAYLALFIALGGTSYAASQITGAQVKDGTLTGADFAAGSISSDQLAPQAKASAKRGKRGPRGYRGYRGPQGVPGVPGPAGAAGISQYEVVRATSPAQSNAGLTQWVSCPSGKRVVGGSGATNVTSGVYISANGPMTDGREGWQVTMVEDGLGTTANWTVSVAAFCAVVQ